MSDLRQFIKIKPGSTASLKMLGKCKPKLAMIFFDFADYLINHGCKDVVLVSIIRDPIKGGSGLHPLGRAIDVSHKGINPILRFEAMEYINNKYQYDPKRPDLQTVIYHRAGYGPDQGYHFHIQTM